MSEVYPEDESMVQHTSGPWEVAHYEGGLLEGLNFVRAVGGGEICSINDSTSEGISNAKLIASAPALLAKVERLERENERMREALELLCYSVAGTEGTKTNSELPEWLRLRFKDAISALSEIEK